MFYKNSVYKKIINKLNLLKLLKKYSVAKNYFKEKSLGVSVFLNVHHFNTKNKHFMWPGTVIGRELPYMQWSV